MKFVGSRQVWPNEKVNRFIDYCTKEKNTNNQNNYYLKIVGKANEFIGIIGIHRDDSKSDFELTYYIHKKSQGKGIGSKALMLMLDKFHKDRPKVKKVLSDYINTQHRCTKEFEKMWIYVQGNYQEIRKKICSF